MPIGGNELFDENTVAEKCIMMIRKSDQLLGSLLAAILVMVTPVQAEATGNLPPEANPNGPYTGQVGVPTQFNSTGSSDPEGSDLFYSWNFGHGISSVVPNPDHT
jgi:hypothetical protein